MHLPLTPHFLAELAFWLLAGHFICEFVLAPKSYVSHMPGHLWWSLLARAFTHGTWVLLATGRIELAIAEVVCYTLTDVGFMHLDGLWPITRQLVHLAHKVAWFICVVWLWPA